MFFLIVVVFWICMLFLMLLVLVIEFGSIDLIIKIVVGLYIFSIVLFFSNSVFNFIVVYIMSLELRKGIYVFFYRILNCFSCYF